MVETNANLHPTRKINASTVAKLATRKLTVDPTRREAVATATTHHATKGRGANAATVPDTRPTSAARDRRTSLARARTTTTRRHPVSATPARSQGT